MALDNNIMNWDDTIENDGQEFVVLPEGDYTFTVTNFERGRFPGSTKIPPCNKATLTISRTATSPRTMMSATPERLFLFSVIGKPFLYSLATRRKGKETHVSSAVRRGFVVDPSGKKIT